MHCTKCEQRASYLYQPVTEKPAKILDRARERI